MLPDDQLVDLRQMVAILRDGRCAQVDADGCRCMRRPDKHAGPCDFSYTPWPAWYHARRREQVVS